MQHVNANMKKSLGCQKVIFRAVAFMMSAHSAVAADTPAPEYYLDALINTTTAQQLALGCPTLSVNLPQIAKATGEVIARLDEDGFTMTAEQTGMTDAAEELAVRQDAFVAKHGLETPSQKAVCAAGVAEIAANTVMGSYLIEVKP